MTNTRAYRIKKLSSLAAIVLALGAASGCEMDAMPWGEEDVEYIRTRMEPRDDFTHLSPNARNIPKEVMACVTQAPIVIYRADMDCPAWKHPAEECSNRNELTLQGRYPQAFPDPENIFDKIVGQDYDVCSVSSLLMGVPASVDVAILESNHLGVADADEAQRSPAAQAHIAEFLDRGGVFVAHLAGNVPEGFGYTVPGLDDARIEDGDSNTMHVAPVHHPFVVGPDGEMGTGDDANDSSIAWLAGESAHQGSLDGILPHDAQILITGAADKPVYAEYKVGSGRVIAGTLTFEFGNDYNINGDHNGFGQRNRLLINHFNSAFAPPPAAPTDNDNDGVPVEDDCDDNNPSVRELLFEDSFTEDNGYFSEVNDADWFFNDTPEGSIQSNGPGHQAVIGQAQNWDNVVIFASLRSEGAFYDEQPFRAGVVARAVADNGQVTGYTGYGCALGSDGGHTSGVPHGGESKGQFLELSEIDDGLSQIGKTDYDFFDFTCGATVELTFYAVGNSFHCEINDAYESVAVSAISDTYDQGTVGLATLNMVGEYHSIKVCRAVAIP
ncbi:MAG: hypothetical protein MJE77_42895 [Proteobacteria bacterium]|nr:hypothetical protein [Pseudomonadota bacterium]